MIPSSPDFFQDQIMITSQFLSIDCFFLFYNFIKDRDKLSKLLAVLALAFCWSYKTGEYVNEEHPITIKTHGRKAQSLFWAGLDHLQRIFDHIETWLDEFIKMLSLFFESRWCRAS